MQVSPHGPGPQGQLLKPCEPSVCRQAEMAKIVGEQDPKGGLMPGGMLLPVAHVTDSPQE